MGFRQFPALEDSGVDTRLRLCEICYTEGLVIIKLVQKEKLAQWIHLKQKPIFHSDMNQFTPVYFELKIIKTNFFCLYLSLF